ncbi:undecaprenylphosphate-alpha-4-amino-4-deoxy-L-arabinosearabinosyltra nsferase [Shewanella sediminis HAW-EB3]|uniref:Undecaprenyl phosphate-alpha-4-amino-4-deoxy-L-arabinose arabinosyl transferase n=1 Tax=Shewanella sediminis (strain HAW-EB3) TaxID=425104 RepID=ARNT_SHESH|nr:lipid IV(A) 4-amino-4-deoxy-L-arabinosyltransferase [Shewanella sediminis]A8FRR0.1 RecName: Full=Undecaprenyl phosphate-alpha-4-amino-4-deoxy-L-arabinose arabinosyl transferase; AltName: Full=4-amino-4-deoxy-L-arabinose lipid A transferase; AltName: Full=Lipid IV(A) 4-amino-4-deoxy-L-arabinosyltransferase; AltName: Full=Undecaprenyl phosphate-alpha-L-Ara4N transferase [Shewanella sediminis HAW-EB3]ABV35533.1 undecaprenylphosphate-alpha-4-amino-4-deoxy-L-arabinosearabinosyltra nsferase [Shewane
MDKSKINLAVIVPLFFIMLYLLPLGLRDLWSPDELRYAEIAREMVDSGNWIVPTFNDIRYFEKPVMGHWMNAISQVLFGENNFSVRAASAFSTLGAAFCLFLLVGRFANRKQAWVTVSVFLSLFLVSNLGTYSVLDGMLNLWLTAAFTAFFYAADSPTTSQRCRFYGLAGLFCACALLTKGFLALALPVIVVVPFMIWQRQLVDILRWGWWVMLVALIVTLPWALAIHAAEPDYWHYFFWVEHIQRFAAEDAQHTSPAWYYLPYLLLGTLPWLFLAPSAIKHLKGHWQSPLLRYALLWALIPFIFFSAAKGKLVTYILPCMAPLAIILAQGIISAFENRAKGLKIGSVINCAFFSLISVAVIVLFYMGRLPLEAEEFYRPWLLVVVCGSWAVLAYISIKAKSLEGKIASYMLMPLSLFLLAWAIIPNISIDSKMPGRFLEQVSPLVSDDAILIADYPSTMSAFNWYFKRRDVYLTGNTGEVSYGIGYDDAKHKYVAPSLLGEFIRKQSVPVVILFREMDVPQSLPEPDKRIERGKFTLVYYDRVKR